MKMIYKHLKNNNFTLAIDTIETNSEHPLQVPPHIKNQKKIKEWINSRHLIKTLWPDLKLSRNSYGAPEIQNGAISISHTDKYVAVIKTKNKAAIDIEKIRSKALKLSKKFMNQQELQKFSNELNATICWSAKECLFKIHQKGKIDFCEDLKVELIEKDFVICYLFDQRIKLNYEKFDDHILLYYYE
jgi:phosphopantetheinyl transferase